MVMWHSSLQHPHHCGVLHLQRDSGPVPGWAVWDLSFSAVFACRSWTPHCRGVLELAEKATEPQPASPFQRLPAEGVDLLLLGDAGLKKLLGEVRAAKRAVCSLCWSP